MKTRDSGMPEEEAWEGFFNPGSILTALGLDSKIENAVDFGCGYGTFALPAAQRISGTLYGLDIDPGMIAECERRVTHMGIRNIKLQVRDFVENGTGLPPECVEFAMLFNLLHAEHPVALLREAWRVLSPQGRVGVIHWNHDPSTPRGPSMDIRPRPQDCQRWMEVAGFVLESGVIDLPPYHYGLVGRKP